MANVCNELKIKFDEKIRLLTQNKCNSISLSRAEYQSKLSRLLQLQDPNLKRERRDYHLLKRYAILDAGDGADGQRAAALKLVKKNTELYFICEEELFDAIHKEHIESGHSGQNRMMANLSKIYANLTKEQVSIYLELCEKCQQRRPPKCTQMFTAQQENDGQYGHFQPVYPLVSELSCHSSFDGSEANRVLQQNWPFAKAFGTEDDNYSFDIDNVAEGCSEQSGANPYKKRKIGQNFTAIKNRKNWGPTRARVSSNQTNLEKSKDVFNHFLSAALDVVALDGLPFSFVNKIGLCRFVQLYAQIAQTWNGHLGEGLLSEQSLRRGMLRRLQEWRGNAEFSSFVSQLQEAGGCLGYYRDAYFLTVYGHILTRQFERQTAMLIFRDLDKKGRKLDEELAEIGLNSEDIGKQFHLVDGTAGEIGMIKRQNSGFEVVCICYLFEQVLTHISVPHKDRLLGQPELDIAARLHSIITRLHAFFNRLKNIELGLLDSKMALSKSHPRFGVDEFIANKFLKNLEHLEQLLNKIGEDKLNAEFQSLRAEEQLLQAYLTVTGIILTWLNRFQANNQPMAQKIFPALAMIEVELKDLQQDSSQSPACHIATAALDALDWALNRERGNKINRQFLLCSAALDPSNWALFPGIFTSLSRWNEDELLDALCEGLARIASGKDTLASDQNNQNSGGTITPARSAMSMFARFLPNKKEIEQPDQGQMEKKDTRDQQREEIALFETFARSFMRQDDDFDVLGFWRGLGQAYVGLQKLARLYLAVPAALVEIERAFHIKKWDEQCDENWTRMVTMNTQPQSNKTEESLAQIEIVDNQDEEGEDEEEDNNTENMYEDKDGNSSNNSNEEEEGTIDVDGEMEMNPEDGQNQGQEDDINALMTMLPTTPLQLSTNLVDLLPSNIALNPAAMIKLEEMELQQTSSGSKQEDLGMDEFANALVNVKEEGAVGVGELSEQGAAEQRAGHVQIQFIRSESTRGRTVIWHEGYRFTHQLTRGGRVYWACNNARGRSPGSCKCTAITTDESYMGYLRGKHNHMPNQAAFERERLLVELKKRAKNEHRAKSVRLIEELKSSVNDQQVLMMLPSDDGLRRQLSRIRKSYRSLKKDGPLDLTVPEELLLKRNGGRFVLWDNTRQQPTGSGGQIQSRVIVFASDRALALLRQLPVWMLDLEFSGKPKGFKQVLAVGAFIGSSPVLCAHALLSETGNVNCYMQVLTALRQSLAPQNDGPQRALLSADPALLSAVRMVFPSTICRMNFFQLSQSLYRSFVGSELGFSHRYLENEVRDFFQRTLGLAFLPPDLVHRAFHLLVQWAPHGLENFWFHFARLCIGLNSKQHHFGPAAFVRDFDQWMGNDGRGLAHSTGIEGFTQIPEGNQGHLEGFSSGGPCSSLAMLLEDNGPAQMGRMGGGGLLDEQMVETAQFPIPSWNMTDKLDEIVPRSTDPALAYYKTFKMQHQRNHAPTMIDFIKALDEHDNKHMETASALLAQGGQQQQQPQTGQPTKRRRTYRIGMRDDLVAKLLSDYPEDKLRLDDAELFRFLGGLSLALVEFTDGFTTNE